MDQVPCHQGCLETGSRKIIAGCITAADGVGVLCCCLLSCVSVNVLEPVSIIASSLPTSTCGHLIDATARTVPHWWAVAMLPGMLWACLSFRAHFCIFNLSVFLSPPKLNMHKYRSQSIYLRSQSNVHIEVLCSSVLPKVFSCIGLLLAYLAYFTILQLFYFAIFCWFFF